MLALFLGAAWWFSRQKTESATRMVRILLGSGALMAGVVLSLRGALALGVPIGVFGLGLLGRFAGKPHPGARQQRPPDPPAASMSAAQAREVLGVGDDADRAEIRAAHRRLMKKLHPDTGEGSAALARQVQEARDVLIARLDKNAG